MIELVEYYTITIYMDQEDFVVHSTHTRLCNGCGYDVSCRVTYEWCIPLQICNIVKQSELLLFIAIMHKYMCLVLSKYILIQHCCNPSKHDKNFSMCTPS